MKGLSARGNASSSRSWSSVPARSSRATNSPTRCGPRSRRPRGRSRCRRPSRASAGRSDRAPSVPHRTDTGSSSTPTRSTRCVSSGWWRRPGSMRSTATPPARSTDSIAPSRSGGAARTPTSPRGRRGQRRPNGSPRSDRTSTRSGPSSVFAWVLTAPSCPMRSASCAKRRSGSPAGCYSRPRCTAAVARRTR